jgi:integrase
MFSNRKSESLGWQALFEALSGVRTCEALAMRLDAEPGNSGAISSDGGFLCVRRAKKSEYEIPQVQLHEGLLDWRAAHLEWHKKRYPNSPWYFPGLRNGGTDHVSNCALTQKFKKLFDQKLLAGRFSSHGMRALYVRIRRSQGVSDAQIAVELNQHGGVATLVKCYGAVPPSWRDGKAPKLAWIPKIARAWTLIHLND